MSMPVRHGTCPRPSVGRTIPIMHTKEGAGNQGQDGGVCDSVPIRMQQRACVIYLIVLLGELRFTSRSGRLVVLKREPCRLSWMCSPLSGIFGPAFPLSASVRSTFTERICPHGFLLTVPVRFSGRHGAKKPVPRTRRTAEEWSCAGWKSRVVIVAPKV